MDQSCLEINHQSSLNRPELVSNYNNAETNRSNQLPNPISPEDIPENSYGIPHQKLVLQLSEPNQKSTPMIDSYTKRPVMRIKSVTTPGGRVVRNISMNNSVKYDISTAYEKYSAAFSDYKNPFRTGSITQDQQQRQPRPSLRRDGQVRRASRHERADLDRPVSVYSSVVKSSRPSTFIHQTSTDSCTSVTSNTQLVNNPYNTVNQKIYSAMWCPCFFFCFLCNFPAIESMRRSNKFFGENNYNKARTYARLSTALFVLGTALSIGFIAGILAIIVLLTA